MMKRLHVGAHKVVSSFEIGGVGCHSERRFQTGGCHRKPWRMMAHSGWKAFSSLDNSTN